MGILIIHADHDTTPSEWERIRSLVESVADGHTTQVAQPTAQPATHDDGSPIGAYEQHVRSVENAQDERLHDPLGEYDDATWQAFSPQKRGSIKRHRNGNDAPFVAAATQVTAPATPATNAMTALYAKAGIATPDVATVPTPEPTPAPVAETVIKAKVDAASQLTPAQRTDLAIWVNEKLQDQRKKDLGNAFLAGKVTLTDLGAFPTKGGKSTLAKDIARVAKCDLVNA